MYPCIINLQMKMKLRKYFNKKEPSNNRTTSLNTEKIKRKKMFLKLNILFVLNSTLAASMNVLKYVFRVTIFENNQK